MISGKTVSSILLALLAASNPALVSTGERALAFCGTLWFVQSVKLYRSLFRK